MSTGPGTQYKFSQTGIEDLTSKIKDLHQQFANGQITYKQYHSSIVEATSQGRAATQEFNQMKGAIAATNPGLLEFTRSMSLFGGVANTVLSVTNAINLAQLAGSGISSQLAQDQSAAAAAYNEYIKDLNAYGPADSRTVAAYNQYHALLNQITFDQNQLARESISTTATLIASGFAIAGSISQTIIGFKALGEMMSPQLAENFAIALSGIGSVLMTWVAPIAIVIAGVEGIYQLLKILDPAFAQTASNLENAIMQNWHVNSIEAALLAPFVGFLGGVAEFGNALVNFLKTIYNEIVSTIINPLVNAWDSSIGKITGQIQQFSQLSIQTLSPNQIMQGLGLGPNALGGSTSTNPNADAINNMLVGIPGNTATVPSSLLNPVTTTAQMSAALKQGSDVANQYLNMINTNGIASNTLATQTLSQQAQATSAVNAYKDSINSTLASLQAQLSTALSQPQTTCYVYHTCSDTGLPSDIRQIPSAAAQQAAQIQQQIANLQAQIPVLDNATSGLGATLNSIGLSAQSGIGSVIAGALGNAAGLGGAGINANQLACFASTGDYGVFTKATIADNATKTPSQQDQINAWINSLGYTPAYVASHPYLQDMAKQALGYAATSTGSSNYSPTGAFGGLPGQYGNPPASSSSCSVFCCSCCSWFAEGGSGVVSSPTKIGVGESGPEYVSVTPLSKGKTGGLGGVNLTVNIAGSLLSQNDFTDKVMQIFKEAMRAGGF